MSKSEAGHKHILLVPKQAMGRLWKLSLLLGLLYAVVFWQSQKGNLGTIRSGSQVLLFVGLVVALLFSVFTLAARNMNYVQAQPTHLRLVTPFLRLKISYRRIHSSHPVKLNQLYPPSEMNWAQRRTLKPVFRVTALGIELTDYPLPTNFLRLFLPKQVFLPGEKGFLLLVEDWMGLSAEIDSLSEAWRFRENRQRM